MKMMEYSQVTKAEAILRLCAALALVLAACLVGFDKQTKLVFYIKKKASFRDLHALEVTVYIDSMAAAYNMLQLSSIWIRGNSKRSSRCLAWFCYLLDQIVVYGVFGGTSAAVEHSVLAVTGAKQVQWMKWCDKYTRFCFQIGGAMTCAYLASLLLLAISSISAFNLFRFYSPNHFLLLKPLS